MPDSILKPPLIRAPELASADWLNTPQPLTLRGLRGGAVLVDFWEYSCVNCLRTLPYLREWHRRYAPHLTIIGVHTPEFPFGREKELIAQAVHDQEIGYPVVLDNAFEIWDAFANRFWPAKYLIDGDGYIRYQSHGEGGYGEFERAIQAVLRERDPNLELPPPMQPLRPEDAPGAVCYRATPELHAGLDRGALGNPEGYGRGAPMLYILPRERPRGAFYVSGAWQAGVQHLAYQGQTEAVIRLPYEAVEVKAVLSPQPEQLDRLVHPEAAAVEIWQDDAPLPEALRGDDVTADGRVLVDRPRLYHLVRNAGFEAHELVLRTKARGFTLFAFQFTSCIR